VKIAVIIPAAGKGERFKASQASGPDPKSKIEVDLSGSSRQARTCINAGPLDTKTAIVAAFKILFDRTTPYTSGANRHIDVVVPPGTVLSAMPPDGAIMLYWEVTQALLTAVMRELGKALGDRAVGGDYGAMGVHNAHGTTASGEPWSSIVTCGDNWPHAEGRIVPVDQPLTWQVNVPAPG